MIFKIIIFILILINCDYKKYLEAHKQNQLGIEKQIENKLEESIPAFHFSKSFQFKSYIPNYNLGNTYLAQKNYLEAHKKYEESLDEKPDFVEAIYNDGILLYLWGKEELDPKICNIEKTKNLWTESKNRFEDSYKKDTSKKYLKQSKENSEFLFLKLKELEEKGKSICEENQKEKENKEQEKNQKQENKQNPENSDSNDKAQNQPNKNQNEKDKSDSKDKNESDQKGNENSEKPKPSLSSDEEKKIGDEIKRIKDKEQNSKSFRRSRHQQSSKKYKTEELKKVLEDTVW